MPADATQIAAITTMAALKGIAFQPSAFTTGEGAESRGISNDGLVLRSDSIGSKWGFNDGDCPDPVMDMVEAWYGDPEYVGNRIWHPILWDLVNEHLLPVLGDTDLDLYLMSTHHNPVRSAHPNLFRHPAGVEVTVPWLTVFAHVVIAIDATFDAKVAAAADAIFS